MWQKWWHMCDHMADSWWHMWESGTTCSQAFQMKTKIRCYHKLLYIINLCFIVPAILLNPSAPKGLIKSIFHIYSCDKHYSYKLNIVSKKNSNNILQQMIKLMIWRHIFVPSDQELYYLKRWNTRPICSKGVNNKKVYIKRNPIFPHPASHEDNISK